MTTKCWFDKVEKNIKKALRNQRRNRNGEGMEELTRIVNDHKILV